MTTPTILVHQNFSGVQPDELRTVAPDAEFRFYETQEGLEADLPDADIVAGEISEAALPRATKLQWVHSWKAGPDSQLYTAFVKSPIVLTCCKGNGAIPLAEHAMMLMLMLNRNAYRWIDNHRSRTWQHFTHGELNGLTVGIIGLGHSGADLALKAKAFHMRTLGLRRSDTPVANIDRLFRRDELHHFLGGADFVVVTAPLTRETRDMLGEAEFRAMKPSAYYICFSRGGLANDAALLKALQENWIAGAGLDAHDVEPLPPHSPFWTLPNVVITPHNGATTLATRQRGRDYFIENLKRHFAGQPLINVVDKRAGY